MPDTCSLLLLEYQRDLTAAMRKIERRKGDSALVYSLLARYGQAAWMLGEKQADMESGLSVALKSIDSLALAIDAGAEYDPDWKERLWLAGFCAIKTLSRYRDLLWSAALRLFNGGRDSKFIGSFTRNIDTQLTEAWNAGAASVGVDKNEMTEDDLLILEAIQRNEFDFVHGLAGEIETDRAGGMEEAKFASKYGARVDLWANRYTETVNRARMHFGSKERLEWVEGPTEKKCSTCPRLAGIVAFGREWEQARLSPQMPPNSGIECKGWGCKCELRPTTKRRTARALDRLLSIRMGA